MPLMHIKIQNTLGTCGNGHSAYQISSQIVHGPIVYAWTPPVDLKLSVWDFKPEDSA